MESSFMRYLLSVGVLCTDNQHLITSVMMGEFKSKLSSSSSSSSSSSHMSRDSSK